jgi:hypothetical protein
MRAQALVGVAAALAEIGQAEQGGGRGQGKTEQVARSITDESMGACGLVDVGSGVKWPRGWRGRQRPPGGSWCSGTRCGAWTWETGGRRVGLGDHR